MRRASPYKYNGKEYIEDFGYDCFAYGFRDYYATIGRFTSIDPLAEISYSSSPYAYAANNPVKNIDWMGLWTETAEGWTTSDPDEIQEFWNLATSKKSVTINDILALIEKRMGMQGDLGVLGNGGGVCGSGDGSGKGLYGAAKPYTREKGDKIKINITQEDIDKLNEMMEEYTQELLDNTCFIRAMSFVNMISKGSKERNTKFFKEEYCREKRISVDKFDGVHTKDELQFLKKYFNILKDKPNVKEAIDRGSLVFCMMTITVNSKYHTVVVVGYKENIIGTYFIFYDPTYGSLWTLPMNYFAFGNKYEVIIK